MNVTDAMVEQAGDAFIKADPSIALRFGLRSVLRKILEAVLTDVPDPYVLTSDLVNADRRAAVAEAKLAGLRAAHEDRFAKTRAALVEHSPSKALAVLDGHYEDFDELLACSSVGQGLRALREDPETELAAVEEELTPEVMEILRRANEPPAWVEQLAKEWETRSYEAGGGQTMLARCARELRERAKQGEP